MNEVYKKCSKCHEWKILSAFYKHKGRHDGLQPFCKACELSRFPKQPLSKECAVCEVVDTLRISTSIRRERVCGICFEGRELGITDKDELSLWSLLQRRNSEREK